MANEVKNCFLINAPAGSGKTTQIKSMVGRFLLDNPKDNILCITYTKRAANELVNDLKSEIRYNKLRKLKIAEKVDTACRSLVE